jgi:hypothetical protein
MGSFGIDKENILPIPILIHSIIRGIYEISYELVQTPTSRIRSVRNELTVEILYFMKARSARTNLSDIPNSLLLIIIKLKYNHSYLRYIVF